TPLDIVITRRNGNGCGSPNEGVLDVLALGGAGGSGAFVSRGGFEKIRLRAKKKNAVGGSF
ncbi:hypothetical protein, partial [Methylosinus sp. sav-2]|uniref:hypothetical protein n=1 Tax=Methylosinus sp. sav-2 TaxID=2485168 RepID=UPI001AB03A86